MTDQKTGMTEEEYEALKAQIRANGYAQYKGRSALSVADLDFIRDAQEAPGRDRPAGAGDAVTTNEPDADAAGRDAGANSQAFTAEHVARTPLDDFSTTVGADGRTQETDPPPSSGAEIPPAVVDALRAAGFDTAEKIVAASDEDLLKVPGVGQATVAKLRAAQAGQG